MKDWKDERPNHNLEHIEQKEVQNRINIESIVGMTVWETSTNQSFLQLQGLLIENLMITFSNIIQNSVALPAGQRPKTN